MSRFRVELGWKFYTLLVCASSEVLPSLYQEQRELTKDILVEDFYILSRQSRVDKVYSIT